MPEVDYFVTQQVIPATSDAISVSPAPVIATTPLPPASIPKLRPYDIDKSSEIWHAKDPSSYITPDNEWVKYYANLLKNNESIELYYRTDKEMYPDAPNEDVWQNADYTLYSQQGDCEDLAIAWVSIFRAYGMKAVVVGGYLEDKTGKWVPDFWVEYVFDGKKKQKIVSESAFGEEYKLIPKYMFNDKIQWQVYNANW